MSENLLDILKEAILLERRGRSLYQQAADQAAGPEVREFFQMLADEEDHHMRVLEKHFKAYADHQRLADMETGTIEHASALDHVLSESLKRQIAAAGFEAAAIAAAMHLEEQAISLYSQRARQMTDPKEKSLFRWLAEWEHDHLTFLVGLEREIREQVWNDRQFWPF